MRLVIPSMILLLAMSGAHGETIYKWIDETGTTHFSDQAPTGKVPQILPGSNEGGDMLSHGSEKSSEDVLLDRQATLLGMQKDPERCRRAQEFIVALNAGEEMRIQDAATGEYRQASNEDLQKWQHWNETEIREHCP